MSSDECQDDCTRTFHLYWPCSKNSPSSALAPPDAGVLPLVYAIHCFGCDASAMKKWERIAEAFNFVLVRPEGINKSWNSRYCCGYALEKKLNDTRFLELIRDEVADRSNRVDKDMVYGIGWSNGGYMVTYAAHLFRSIVPIAGYQYENIKEIAGNSPRGIFQHHSLNDQFVQFDGCCTDSTKKKCCCGISEASPEQCNSVDATFDDWAKQVNQCTSTTTVFKDIVKGIECRSGNGCVANSTLCVYENSKHFNMPSFSRAFPMFEEVGHFLARDACSANGGRWEMDEKSCTCDKVPGDRQSGLYCSSIGDKSYAGMSHQIDQEANASSGIQEALVEWFVLATVALFAGAIILHWRKNGRTSMYKKEDEWKRLSTSEPTDVELTSR